MGGNSVTNLKTLTLQTARREIGYVGHVLTCLATKNSYDNSLLNIPVFKCSVISYSMCPFEELENYKIKTLVKHIVSEEICEIDSRGVR